MIFLLIWYLELVVQKYLPSFPYWLVNQPN